MNFVISKSAFVRLKLSCGRNLIAMEKNQLDRTLRPKIGGNFFYLVSNFSVSSNPKMSKSANNGVRAEKSVLGQQEARCLQVLSPSPFLAHNMKQHVCMSLRLFRSYFWMAQGAVTARKYPLTFCLAKKNDEDSLKLLMLRAFHKGEKITWEF